MNFILIFYFSTPLIFGLIFDNWESNIEIIENKNNHIIGIIYFNHHFQNLNIFVNFDESKSILFLCSDFKYQAFVFKSFVCSNYSSYFEYFKI